MTGAEIIPSLDFETANELIKAVITIWGIAYIFRLAINVLLNKR